MNEYRYYIHNKILQCIELNNLVKLEEVLSRKWIQFDYGNLFRVWVTISLL